MTKPPWRQSQDGVLDVVLIPAILPPLSIHLKFLSSSHLSTLYDLSISVHWVESGQCSRPNWRKGGSWLGFPISNWTRLPSARRPPIDQPFGNLLNILYNLINLVNLIDWNIIISIPLNTLVTVWLPSTTDRTHARKRRKLPTTHLSASISLEEKTQLNLSQYNQNPSCVDNTLFIILGVIVKLMLANPFVLPGSETSVPKYSLRLWICSVSATCMRARAGGQRISLEGKANGIGVPKAPRVPMYHLRNRFPRNGNGIIDYVVDCARRESGNCIGLENRHSFAHPFIYSFVWIRTSLDIRRHSFWFLLSWVQHSIFEGSWIG